VVLAFNTAGGALWVGVGLGVGIEGLDPVVVDVRTTTGRSLEPRQIPGSLHVPLEALDLHIGNLPHDRDIVLYCTCPNEASAARVAKRLMDRGFKRVRPLHGGLDAWIAAGYRIESLPPPPS
jgi:rhodanese-related sulfurtransferase